MKLLAGKKRKVAVLLTSGIGDALLFTPLLRELKQKGFIITCIFYSKFDNDCFFDPSLVDSKVFIRSKLSLLWYSLTRLRYFSNYYINHFGNGHTIRLAAQICSKRVTKTCTGYKAVDRSKRNRAVFPELTDAEQNLHLLYSRANAKITDIKKFHQQAVLPLPAGLIKNNSKQNRPYFIVQVSAGNNRTPFKNWPMQNWVTLIERLCRSYPNFEFVIAGDDTESEYIKTLENIDCTNCSILIGKTTVKEVFALTGNSAGYIGLDSGIMHMAVALQKRTVTIFGASNESLYGYETLNPGDHKVIRSSLTCRPCSGWKNANTSRVNDPMLCPDFACLNSITPGLVFEQIIAHFNL
ncbi:MAG TPA: glycosyltransferase family 9 protein [Ferruginibacter sp.]|nr:glycosyltransferase family 9 protein [Ferruginibacter sp.]